MSNGNILTVTQLNMYVKGLLEGEPNLKSVYIVGEISNFTNHYKSGHFYLTLKDDKASIKAVMFRSAASKLMFELQNGMRVICSGRVSLFERDGSYQFYIDSMQPDGVGALQIAYEQLKQKLSKLGMFDDVNKQPIPRVPQRIAVITSPTGAAVQDIMNILSRRFPLAQVVMCPVLVQGELAPDSLTDAVLAVNELNCADVIIIGRGGGSIEDLWAFNSEKLAYAIFNSHIPVISAVGHETDFTICDFVADLRAPTPSAAAELAVPDSAELGEYFDITLSRLKGSVRSMLSAYEARLKALSSNRLLRTPSVYFDHIGETVDSLESRLKGAAEKALQENLSRLSVLSARLDAMSPLKTLARGYVIVKNSTGDVVKSVSSVSKGETVSVTLADGSFDSVINNIYTE